MENLINIIVFLIFLLLLFSYSGLIKAKRENNKLKTELLKKKSEIKLHKETFREFIKHLKENRQVVFISDDPNNRLHGELIEDSIIIADEDFFYLTECELWDCYILIHEADNGIITRNKINKSK